MSMAYGNSPTAIFTRELDVVIRQFSAYESVASRNSALAVVPFEFLKGVAKAKYESSHESHDNNLPGAGGVDKEKVLKDMFLLELMSWFKNDFFTWMDSPNCPKCQKPTEGIGTTSPTPEELSKSAGHVEVFTCRNCSKEGKEVARFPRYNHPVVLLTTRTGRCGEWANCFALIVRSAGYEVRHVKDWTDHVWVEVFSSSLSPNRWVHMDPCENAYDSPLLYDRGWGKKLSYCIAVCQDDIQDVTWRYVQESHFQEVLANRTKIPESTLITLLIKLRARLQKNVSAERKEVLRQRLIQELVEFLYPRSDKEVRDSEKGGRASGSLAWRLARQELGSSEDEPSSGYVWQISKGDLSNGKFTLTYNCAKDQYSIHKSATVIRDVKRGWNSGVKTMQNMFRKVEQDWKMVYLARQENAANKQATISWQFSLSDPELEIRSVRIQIAVSTFHSSASISITLTDEGDNLYKLVETSKAEGTLTWNSDSSFRNCTSLTLTCNLEGGEGREAWQHAQLFRQALNASEDAMKLEMEVLPKSIN